ncbi:hypothetical protein CU098_008178, partial [Rhizopus stolonifer]
MENNDRPLSESDQPVEQKPTSSAKVALPTLDEFVPLKKPTQNKTPVSNITEEKKPVDWQDDVLSRILQVTLNPNNMYKQGKCVYLSGLVNELMEEQGKLILSQHILDRIIVARLSLDPTESHDDLPQDIAVTLTAPHFDYLLNCWKTVHDIKRNTLLRSKNLEKSVLDQRLNVLDNVKALIVSYSGLVLQMPDMFPQLQ